MPTMPSYRYHNLLPLAGPSQLQAIRDDLHNGLQYDYDNHEESMLCPNIGVETMIENLHRYASDLDDSADCIDSWVFDIQNLVELLQNTQIVLEESAATLRDWSDILTHHADTPPYGEDYNVLYDLEHEDVQRWVNEIPTPNIADLDL